MNEIKFNKSIAAITAIVEKYRNIGRFTEEITKSVLNSIEGQDLKIAVIGKMKAGKSSFTNALIFHKNVLPSGSEPTTVTLTEMVYTADPIKDSRVEVELLTVSDIADLETNAQSENAQIAKNAKELLESIKNIPGGAEQYISKGIVEIDLSELIKFTSTEGILSGLAKKVTIYKHLDVLRGLKITDTPGFNDPIKSRGEATKKALKDSHIILFIHDYLDKYDQDEISILLEQVEYSGVSMLVDIINKMDMHEDLQIPEWASYIPKFERKKEEAIKQIPKGGIKTLLGKGETSYVSALMALIGYEVLQYNQKKDKGSESHLSDDIKEFFVQYQSDFPELKDANDFIRYSHIAGIVDIINQLASDKSKYLANYPVQTLQGNLKSLISIITEEIKQKNTELRLLQNDAAQAKRQLDTINGTFKALGNHINSPLLATTLRECIRKTKHDIQNRRDNLLSVEFTSSNYEKEGNIFNSDPENRNLARYKGVLADFDNIIRNLLEKLKDDFDNQCEAYINNLVEELIKENITEEDRNLFSSVLISLLKSEISKGLPIAVNPDEPSSCLYGAGTQYSLYRSDFLERRSDSVIEETYLKIFRTFVDSSISSNVLRDAITEQIEDLKAKLKGAINYSPSEKEEVEKKLKNVIIALETELCDLNDEIKLLEELKEV